MGKIQLVILLFVLASCSPPVQEEPQKKQDLVTEEFIRVNQYSQRRHQDHIAAFVERVGWKAETTPTGLWIVVDSAGQGPAIKEHDRVAFSYNSFLLNGKPCYSAGEKSPKTIIMGNGGVEAGLEEGLKKLHEGAVATLIIPPHLGHGNFGDRNRIPGNSVLIYHLKILQVQ